MTTQEKAIAYDEALRRAKELYSQKKVEWKDEDIETIFPVLKETEDERIRKRIIKFVQSNTLILQSEQKQMCEWLDKQAEQKPAVWSGEDAEAIKIAIIALEDMFDPESPLNCYAGTHIPFDVAADRLKNLLNQNQ